MNCPLNDFGFDKIYCINLKTRPDRKEHAQQQFDKVGLDDVSFFWATDGVGEKWHDTRKRFTPGMIGCFKSHQRIWKDAITHGYHRILVFEDDLRFVDNFNEFLTVCLPGIPEDWQFAWLGYKERDGYVKAKVSDWWAKPKDTWGTQGYMFNGLETIQAFYKLTTCMSMQIDEQMSRIIIPQSGAKAYSVFPSIVRQHKDLGTNCQYT